MAAPSDNVVRVPQPEKGSYNPHRPVQKNTLLLHHVLHFREVEKALPADQWMVFAGIKTEADASAYIRRMTAFLHPHGAKVKKAT